MTNFLCALVLAFLPISVFLCSLCVLLFKKVHSAVLPPSCSIRVRRGTSGARYLSDYMREQPSFWRYIRGEVKTATLLAALCAAFLGDLTLHAAPAAPLDRMLQQEQKQQQLKTTTQRVASQLNAIIEEFQRNGIEGEDVKVLRAIGGVLGRLSEKDMDKVIAFLQQARSSEDPNASTRRATDAYASQKSIIIQL